MSTIDYPEYTTIEKKDSKIKENKNLHREQYRFKLKVLFRQRNRKLNTQIK